MFESALKCNLILQNPQIKMTPVFIKEFMVCHKNYSECGLCTPHAAVLTFFCAVWWIEFLSSQKKKLSSMDLLDELFSVCNYFHQFYKKKVELNTRVILLNANIQWKILYLFNALRLLMNIYPRYVYFTMKQHTRKKIEIRLTERRKRFNFWNFSTCFEFLIFFES